jgi:hypothetical protein
MSVITIKSGQYRNQPIKNKSFTLVRLPVQGKKGLYVTVRNEGNFDIDVDAVRIKVDCENDFHIDNVAVNIEPVIEETDIEAMDRIATRFEILDQMAAACIDSHIRAMIVSGPPGVGKSYGINQQLERFALINTLSDTKERYNIVKGNMTALGLYIQLYNYKERGQILVFDDCDTVLNDPLSLNILKAALDTSKRRKICWNSDSRLLKDESIPNTFDFEGSVIFVTNIKFANVRSANLREHLSALESRCHFLDLTINTNRDLMLRIRQVDRDKNGGLFADYEFKNNESDDILAFMEQNEHRLRELSIRMALKIADLVNISPNNWQMLAQNTVMNHS